MTENGSGFLETRMDAVSDSVADHETRIRVNEGLAYKMLAVAMTGSFLGGALTMLIAFLATR